MSPTGTLRELIEDNPPTDGRTSRPCPGKRVIFVDRLPRLATGKVDKVALRKPYWENEARHV